MFDEKMEAFSHIIVKVKKIRNLDHPNSGIMKFANFIDKRTTTFKLCEYDSGPKNTRELYLALRMARNVNSIIPDSHGGFFAICNSYNDTWYVNLKNVFMASIKFDWSLGFFDNYPTIYWPYPENTLDEMNKIYWNWKNQNSDCGIMWELPKKSFSALVKYPAVTKICICLLVFFKVSHIFLNSETNKMLLENILKNIFTF